jgi:hypothetical protein
VCDAQQLLDDPRLDVVAHDRPGVGIEPDRQVGTKRICHGREHRDGGLTKTRFALLQVPSVNAGSVTLNLRRLMPASVRSSRI